jgi:hypothetical protein
MQSLTAFKQIYSEKMYSGMILATTRWDEVGSDCMALATQREQELRTKTWCDVLDCGGRVVSLTAGRLNALKIISHIVTKDLRLTL